ncbi:MAG: hypothetical protein COV00_00040 [Candidatus Tagabacteria bacterium CG10_big_fil_rev_8_21_14_0_10_40_13]|uniref:Polymerase nucleotidyl transferase domain-containing protein n=2 Tax=Parcubacteria group TaxID=1794811 RepID=A0A2M7UGV8_9BACT|nr:MAG: hypothetical protein AUJ33_02215 [Parcubacteria group bacterium CG1_02_40_25]PIZ70484.1 MAG: hypothetical protein COY09_02875 [Candidatus Portnoybacteria bacterium CG_4_10_14_0_2_um_filter_39_11]PJE73402.1 MAG: hypothetical protein COV00_00040 [Candidatus Tagabacteria bacterium CG10_big_fil_rev_8_21_14_0_10_40_13]
MPNINLINEAKKLQQQARQILKELGLLEVLGEISEPKIVGSVASGLIIAKDIDLHAYVKVYDLQKIVALIPRLVFLPTIQKVQFSNFRELRRDWRKDKAYLPHAYYLGLRSVQPSGEWKIDIWFAKKDDIQVYQISEQDVSNEQRQTILKLKKLWYIGDGYRDKVISIDFYNAVLKHRVKTVQDFRCYLKEK